LKESSTLQHSAFSTIWPWWRYR